MNTELTDLAAALDPAVFGRTLGLALDAWLIALLRSELHRILVLCGRQVGKSTTAAVLALHRAVYFPDNTLIVTQRFPQP